MSNKNSCIKTAEYANSDKQLTLNMLGLILLTAFVHLMITLCGFCVPSASVYAAFMASDRSLGLLTSV